MIAAVSVDRKKLIVSGQNFVAGSLILINGQEQPTENVVEDPPGRLMSRKAGKKIKPGESAMIQVKTPDGTISQEFNFARPAN